MAVRTNQAAVASRFIDEPESIGPALAQVVHVDAERDVILGQAWVAGPNQLVTCGHVVEQFARDAAGLFVYFPSSGKRYPVQSVRLHPSFVRQPDGLVKFDAALITAVLSAPDTLSTPLPFAYEHEPTVNEPLWTIRYPVHLGQFSAALQPLSQQGRFLGFLRKHDNFHLLHDVPLAPGDSGSPITDGQVVIAMHCGDTATLPGLNLPTTSIRLALWVDALREFGLQPTRKDVSPNKRSLMPLWSALIVSLIIAFAIVSLNLHAPAPIAEPVFKPMRIEFNQPIDSFKPDDAVEFRLTPGSDTFAFVFLIDKQGDVLKLLPVGSAQALTKGEVRIVDKIKVPTQGQPGQWHEETLKASAQDFDLLVVGFAAANPDASAFAEKWLEEGNGPLLKIPAATLIQQASDARDKFQGAVFMQSFHLKANP